MVVAAAVVMVVQVISMIALGTAARRAVRNPSGPCLRPYKPSGASRSTGLIELNRRRHPRSPGGDFPCGESSQEIYLENISTVDCETYLLFKLYYDRCIVLSFLRLRVESWSKIHILFIRK